MHICKSFLPGHEICARTFVWILQDALDSFPRICATTGGHCSMLGFGFRKLQNFNLRDWQNNLFHSKAESHALTYCLQPIMRLSLSSCPDGIPAIALAGVERDYQFRIDLNVASGNNKLPMNLPLRSALSPSLASRPAIGDTWICYDGVICLATSINVW